MPTIPVSDDGNEFIHPVGIIFLKSIKGIQICQYTVIRLLVIIYLLLLSYVDPWQLHLSKSGKFYYFNCQNGASQFDCPTSSVANYV